MPNLLNRLFSDKYANRNAIGNNVLLLYMYRFSFPFSVVLSRLHFSPNQITTLSILFSIAASLSLMMSSGWILFVIFWWLSLLFDFCDGTVARMTDNVRKTAFRYDHTSDLFKIFLIILAVAIRYQDEHIWIMALMASFFFMFYMVINHDLGTYRRRNSNVGTVAIKGGGTSTMQLDTQNSEQVSVLLKTYKAIYAAVMTINGHTLLLFFIFPFGKYFALFGLSYLAAISLFRISVSIHVLRSIPK